MALRKRVPSLRDSDLYHTFRTLPCPATAYSVPSGLLAVRQTTTPLLFASFAPKPLLLFRQKLLASPHLPDHLFQLNHFNMLWAPRPVVHLAHNHIALWDSYPCSRKLRLSSSNSIHTRFHLPARSMCHFR